MTEETIKVVTLGGRRGYMRSIGICNALRETYLRPTLPPYMEPPRVSANACTSSIYLLDLQKCLLG